MGRPKARRSCKHSRGRKKGYFKPGHLKHEPSYRNIDLQNDESTAEVHSRLTLSEAVDVLHLTKHNTTENEALPYKLRPKPEIETNENGYDSEKDENFIVEKQCLVTLMSEIHKQHCANACIIINIERRHGLCVTLSVNCQSCHYRSTPVELSSRIKKRRGVGTAELNERLLLPVLKSRMGIDDVSYMLSCLNIKQPSTSLMQRKLNDLSDKAEEVGEQQLLENQEYVKRILTLSGSTAGVDVQTDNAFPCRPQGGGEKSKQSFSAVIEHTTTKCLVITQSTANKFCKKKECKHENCSKNYPTQESIAASERILLNRNLDKIRRNKKLKINSITTDASSQLAKAVRDYKTEHRISMKHYNCYIHKLRNLEKHLRAVKIQSKLPTGQEKSAFIKTLAAAIRARVRLELQNAKTLKYDDNDFLLKCTSAFENIISCFSNNHIMCRKVSTVCQHYMAALGKYTTKHLPYGQHIKLNNADMQNIKSVIRKTLDVHTIKGVAELFNTNRCESLHSTIFNYAPKFSCWPRNFAGLCHSATQSRTLGKGVATVKLACAIGINVKRRSQMYFQLKRLDRKRKYHAERKETAAYKQSRYFLRKRINNRSLFQESLYTGQPSALSQEHSYGVNS